MLKSYYLPKGIEAGCDEAGRGCLAGPVYAASVVLPSDFHHPMLNDSKVLSESDRDELRIIIENEAVSWAVARLTPKEIDRYNILNASFMAMHRALKKLTITPDRLLIDGNRFIPYKKIPYECIVKGDGKYASIAAASILAKTHRDEYMKSQHTRYPYYSWNTNKGYPTQAHRKAIKVHGSCKLHRKTFKLLPNQLDLFNDQK